MKQKYCCVYMLTFPSQKSYIGVSVNPDRRWKAHVHAAQRGEDLAVHRAIRKYGHNDVVRTVLFESRAEDCQAVCFSEEKALIAFHNTLHPTGYNLLEGGDTASGYSQVVAERHRTAIIAALADPSVRKKMSEIGIARFSNPANRLLAAEKTRAYFKNNPEARVNLSMKARKAHTPEHQKKMTDASIIAMKMPDEVARRAECARKVANNPSIRAAINAAVAKPVICIETGEVFETIAAAVRWLQANGQPLSQKSKISQVANGTWKSAYGYTWRYAGKNSGDYV